MEKIAFAAFAVAIFVGTAFADPITYELIAHVTGQVEGSKPVGTITFADGSAGASSYDIATAGTEFDLRIVDYSSTIPGWKSGDTGISANGILRFSTGVIGDAVLTPFQHPGAPNFDTFERWSFRFDVVPLTGAPTGPPDLLLQLFADSFSDGWQFQDFPPITPANPNGFPTVNDFSFLSSRPPSIVEWDLRIVPEPGTVFLSGFAIAGILVWRRRKRVA